MGNSFYKDQFIGSLGVSIGFVNNIKDIDFYQCVVTQDKNWWGKRRKGSVMTLFSSASDLRANQNTHCDHQLITSHSIIRVKPLAADYKSISDLRPHCSLSCEYRSEKERALSGQPDIRFHVCYVIVVMSSV